MAHFKKFSSPEKQFFFCFGSILTNCRNRKLVLAERKMTPDKKGFELRQIYILKFILNH